MPAIPKAPPHTAYPLLSQVTDPHLREVLKLILDKTGNVEQLSTGIGAVTKPLVQPLDSGGNTLKNLADPAAGQDAVTLTYLQKYVQAALAKAAVATPATTPTPASAPPPSPTPTPNPTPNPVPTPGTCYTSLILGQPAGVPATPNLRWFRGDFCGVNVSGLPVVNGGAADTTLVFTPFIDRYTAAQQAAIFAAYKAKGYTHFVVSWPDSRAGGGVGSPGQTVAQFVATCQLVQANGFYPVVFLTSKVFDQVNVDPTTLDAVMTALVVGACVPIACVGWELDLFNTPGATVQALITHVCNALVPAGTNVYVHFSEGYVAWQAPGDPGSAFWAANVGKLTGILHQKKLTWDCPTYQSRLADLQLRFGTGADGYPASSGFGHPFDIVAYEYAAMYRFNGQMAEAGAITIGNEAICSPSQSGGPTPLPIMGFANGGPAV